MKILFWIVVVITGITLFGAFVLMIYDFFAMLNAKYDLLYYLKFFTVGFVVLGFMFCIAAPLSCILNDYAEIKEKEKEKDNV